MMRLFFIAFLLLPIRLFSATTYPLIGLEIETNGFILRATVATDNALGVGTASTNGGFFNGLGTNNSLSSTTALVLTMTEMGYDGNRLHELVVSRTRRAV